MRTETQKGQVTAHKQEAEEPHPEPGLLTTKPIIFAHM